MLLILGLVSKIAISGVVQNILDPEFSLVTGSVDSPGSLNSLGSVRRLAVGESTQEQ